MASYTEEGIAEVKIEIDEYQFSDGQAVKELKVDFEEASELPCQPKGQEKELANEELELNLGQENLQVLSEKHQESR
jgi:hypothetical protein